MTPVHPLTARDAWIEARAGRLALERSLEEALARSMRALLLQPDNPIALQTWRAVAAILRGRLPYPVRGDMLSRAEAVEGWMHRSELALLAASVYRLKPDAAIVEIGSYKGRSTLLLALVAADRGIAQPILAIDPHDGYGPANGTDTCAALQQTLASHRVAERVEIVRQRSIEVALPSRVDLALIDGLHDRASVEADAAHVLDSLRQGGLLVFHDYALDYPGVVQVVNDLLNGSMVSLQGLAQSLIVLEKV